MIYLVVLNKSGTDGVTLDDQKMCANLQPGCMHYLGEILGLQAQVVSAPSSDEALTRAKENHRDNTRRT